MSQRHIRTNADRCSRLLAIMQPANTMLILLQDCPDPDAIAAAAALREIANRCAGISCTLAHGGVVGRAENAALAKYLALNLRPKEDALKESFDLVAMVDAQPGTGNSLCPDALVPDIVIDHHPIRQRTRRSPYTDVRRRYGATSTILYEYMALLGLVPDKPLATALLYGIRSDTQDLGREASQADIHAHLELYILANQRMLARIQTAAVPRDYFSALADALSRASVAGEGVFCRIDHLGKPDMVAEVADLLLRLESCSWALSSGVSEGKMFLSLRRKADEEAEAGDMMHKLVRGLGTGGGHGTMAGGQIPLAGLDVEKVTTKLLKRFMRLIGSRIQDLEPLVNVPQRLPNAKHR